MSKQLALLGLPLLAGCGLTYDPDLVVERTRGLFGERGEKPRAIKLQPEADLAACLRYGLQHSPKLRAAFERWRAAVERVPQVSALPEPVLSFAHFVEEIQTRTGPQRNRIGVSQSFPWFGKLEGQGAVARKAADSLWARVEATRLEVIRRIKRTWYQYAWVGTAIRIDEQILRLLQQVEPIAQRRIQGGASQADLLRLQVEIGKLENDIESLRKLAPTIATRLDAILGRQAGPALRPPALAAPTSRPLSLDELTQRLLAANPELAALEGELGQSEKKRDLAELGGWPDFTVGVDWFETGEALAPGTPGSGDDPISLRLSLSLPVWRGKYAAAEREARHGVEAAAHRLQERRLALRADLEFAAYQLGDADRRLGLYRSTLLPRARQAFELTRASYRTAKASLLDVIDAERMLLNFEKVYWRAAANYEQNLADVEAICGGEIDS